MLLALSGLVAIAAVPGAPVTCPWRRGDVVELTGVIETGGLTGRFTRRAETGTGRLFEADDLGIVTTRSGFDGRLAWSQDISGGVHDLNSGFARRLAVSMAWLDGRQSCAPSANARMERLGDRADGGRRFAAWRAAPTGGVPFELWYDAQTGQLDRAFFQMAESRLVRHFADWREIAGGRFVAFEQRDEYPEDEDEVVRRADQAIMRSASAHDFSRPKPPSDLVMLNGQRSANVPFEDDHRTRIYVPVYLNEQGPFLFELDSGGHNIVTAETAQALGLSGTGSFSSTGAGNAVAQSGIARIKRIRIGDVVLTDQPVRIRQFSAASNDRSPNGARAGILGLELFERLVVAIDPVAKTVTLSPFSSAVRPAGKAMPLIFAEDAPLVEGSYRGRRGDFMLDTGDAGPTIIEDYWARPLGLTPTLNKGIARGDAKVSRAAVGLGHFRLDDELVSCYGPAQRGSEYSRAVAGVYSEPLLSRFKTTYDYSRGTVWLKPLPGESAVPFDRSGLAVTKTSEGAFQVSAVLPGTPADRAGVAVGDRIDTLKDIPAARLSRADAADLLRGPPGTTIELTGRFGDADGRRFLTLRELLPPAPRESRAGGAPGDPGFSPAGLLLPRTAPRWRRWR